MKKIKITFAAFIVCIAALLGGCSGGESSVDRSDLQSEATLPSGGSSQNEPSEPNGSPTFLIGADGLPIYTSEITEVSVGEFGDEIIPVEELNESTFAQVICKGFAYVHDSRINILATDEPDKFENGVYIGEELSPSTEFRRLRTGDKVGTLTVRDAETVFSRDSEIATGGKTYLSSSSVYFDGEVTVTGYISIYENPLYQDGMVSLMPIESPLPQMFYQYANGVGISHVPVFGDGSYGETALFSLGYLEGTKVDMSGLRIGDTNVKVCAVIGSVRAGGGSMPMYFGELLHVEILND